MCPACMILNYMKSTWMMRVTTTGEWFSFLSGLNFNLSLVRAPFWKCSTCIRISLTVYQTSLVHRTVLSLWLNQTYSSPTKCLWAKGVQWPWTKSLHVGLKFRIFYNHCPNYLLLARLSFFSYFNNSVFS